MEHKFSKHFCVWLRNCLAFLFCITFSLQCNAMCYNYGEVECKAGQYYEGKCKDCSSLDKDHYKCTKTTSWCASGSGVQGLSKCLDLKRDDGTTNYMKRKFVDGYCTNVAMYIKANEVPVWDNDDEEEVWYPSHFDSQDGVPMGAYGSHYGALDSYGWVDLKRLNKVKDNTPGWFIKDGKNWYLPYETIITDSGLSPKECPAGFFAFGAQYCVKIGIKDVDSAKRLDTITKDNIANVEKMTHEQIELYNDAAEKELPEAETNSDNEQKMLTGGVSLNYSPNNYSKPDINTKVYALNVSVECKAGTVWFNGACTPCTSNVAWVNYAKENRLYCPGGSFLNSARIIEQIDTCPKGMKPNATLSGCDCIWGIKDVTTCNINKIPKEKCNICKDVVLSFDDLKYGPLGKNAPLFKQCWTKVTEKAYKKCMGFDN